MRISNVEKTNRLTVKSHNWENVTLFFLQFRGIVLTLQPMRFLYLTLLFCILAGCRPGTTPILIAEQNLEEARRCLQQDDYEEAIRLYYEALFTLEKEGIKHTVQHDIYSDLGSLYRNQGLYNNALEVYMNQYALAKQDVDPDKTTLALRNVALTNLYLKQVDSCYFYLQEAFIHAEQAEDRDRINDMLHNDMSLYFNKVEEYEQSLCHLEMIQNPDDEVLANKGFVFMRLHNYDSARHNLLRATESELLHIRSSAYCSLAELEGDMENYQEAYYYQSRYQQALDSIQAQLHTEEINTILHKHLNERQNAQIKMKYRLGIWLLLSLFTLLIVAGVFLFQLNNRRKKIKEQEQENQLLRKEMEVLALQEQHYRNFKEKPIFQRVKELEQRREILSYKDQEELKREIHFYFRHYIKELQEACPRLKGDDLLLCCLAKLDLPSETITLCMGYSDTNTFRQRKHRIKKKIVADSDNPELFDSIFNPEPPTL